ncbi:der1-like family protein [Colletotrichum truncatum]|uniref:Der1-like family protein n=1 Tax=Colletotrichum truncatum TaxID=5467 RepID=A0ACC3ZIN9_COLTU|nr:der1-like family protein [Colletotrichum truncatum]KAF6791790.1 der1-like family protein [Colletotrichum truncatum]
MSEMLDVYWQAPPIARTLATATFVTSVSVLLGIVSPYWFIFMPDYLYKIPPQIWRLGTNFLLTGPQLSLLFDTYFLYTYLTALEVGNPRFARREDVVWYLMFVCTVITVSLYITASPLLRRFCPCSLSRTTRKVPSIFENTQARGKKKNSLLAHFAPHISARIVDTHSYSGSWN